MDSNSRIYAYGIYALAAFVLALAALFYNAYLVAASAALLLLSVLYMRSGHIINNLLIRHSNIIELGNGYRINENLRSAVAKAGRIYKSVSAAELVLSGASDYGSEKFAEVVEKAKVPFRFTIGIREIDRKAFAEALETKRRMKEIALSNTPATAYDKANRLRREIAILDSELKGVASGGKPVEAFAYVSSEAFEQSEGSAARASARQLEQIADIFSATLGIACRELRGEELLAFVGG